MDRPLRVRNTIQLAIAALGLALPIGALQTQTVYVSGHGLDQAVGSKSSPVATIERTVALARRTREHAVEIEGGTYVLTTPLHLTAPDSGLSLKAAAGQNVIVSGGVRVQRWKVVDRRRSLWSAMVPAGVKAPRQSYIDRVRASRAKGRVPIGLTMTDEGYTADSDLLAHWKHPEEMEFVYTGGNALRSEPEAGLGGWTEPRCPVAAIRGATIEINGRKMITLGGAHRTFVALDGLTPAKHYRFGVSAINPSGVGAKVWVDDKHID